MTARKPIVLISGKMQELPSGDWVAGGAAGATGSTPTVAVGTVTTGAAGSSATVTNSGTSTAAVFDFTIPKGDTGATGSTGYTLLESHTASSSSSLDFTSFISSSYDVYVFEFENIVPATSTANLNVVFGTGGTPTWDTTSGHYIYAGFATTSGGTTAQANSTGTTAFTIGFSLATTANRATVGHLKLYKPSDTGFQKNTTWQTNYANSGGTTVALFGGGTYNQTTAVTAVRFIMSSGNIASGTIRVHGIANT